MREARKPRQRAPRGSDPSWGPPEMQIVGVTRTARLAAKQRTASFGVAAMLSRITPGNAIAPNAVGLRSFRLEVDGIAARDAAAGFDGCREPAVPAHRVVAAGAERRFHL